MDDESTQPTQINLVRMDDGRWRVFVNDEDMGTAFQFPWDALQCALNGSLSGRPIVNLQTLEISASVSIDQQRLARARAAEVEHRALIAALRGIDGEGI